MCTRPDTSCPLVTRRPPSLVFAVNRATSTSIMKLKASEITLPGKLFECMLEPLEACLDMDSVEAMCVA